MAKRLTSSTGANALSLLGLLFTAGAGAQPGSDGPALEEVVVTAQKREERLIDVPISISAFTERTLTDANALQLSDILQTAPGVGIVDNQSGTQNIQIRGINSTFGNAPVGYYLDELPFSLVGNTQVPDVRLYDLQRVEVLRGPQGTLYGDGSIGGTIRMLTNDPDLETFAGSVDLTAGSISDGDNNFAVKGMLNAPLTDTVGLRVVASIEEFGGWVDNTVTGETDQNERDIDTFRGKLRFTPNDRLDLVLSAWSSEQDVIGSANALDDGTLNQPAPDFSVEYDLYSAALRYGFDAFDLVSATSFMDYESDSITFIAGLFDFTENTDQDVLSQELRLASTGSGPLRWTAGLFFRSMERDTFAALPAFSFTQSLDLESDAFAVFGELTWTFLDDKLDLTAGLRYFEDDRSFVEAVDPALLDLIQMVDPGFEPSVDETFDSTNPRLNLSYRVNEDWMFYSNVAKGFRTGQPQPALSLGLAALSGLTIPRGIDPEEMWSYEIGTKGTFWDGRALFEAAAYFNDWEDLQVPIAVSPQVRALVNGGTAETQGIEFGLTLAPIDDLQIKFNGGYTDAEFTESVSGINISDGDQIPGVPEITLSVSGTYRWPLRGALQGFAHAAVQYADERTDTINLALPSDETTRLDLRAGIEADRWALYGFVENATDEDGAIDVFLQGPMGPATRYRPRTVGLQFRTSF